MVPYQVNFGENPTIVYSSVAIMNKKNHFTLDAQGWCTGKTQRDRVGREVGWGIGMGNTCKSIADSCQWMAKTTTIL